MFPARKYLYLCQSNGNPAIRKVYLSQGQVYSSANLQIQKNHSHPLPIAVLGPENEAGG